MRNRDIQRWLKKNQKERGVSPRDITGILDLTAYEAVKRIVADEKKELLKRYWESVNGNAPLSDKDADEIISILATSEEDQEFKLPVTSGGSIGNHVGQDVESSDDIKDRSGATTDNAEK